MRKFLLFLLLLLPLCSWAQVNEGIETRDLKTTFTLTNPDTTTILFNLSGADEQGLCNISVICDSTDTLGIRFASQINIYGKRGCATYVQVGGAGVTIPVIADSVLGPISITYIQSTILTDSSKYMTGYIPAASYLAVQLFQVGASPASNAGIAVLSFK